MAQDEPAPPDEPLSSVTEPSSVPAASEPPPSGAPPPPPPPLPPPPTSSSSNSTTILYDRPTSIPNGAASHLRQNGSYSSSAAPEAKPLTDAGTGHNSDMSGGYYPPGGPDPHRSDHLRRQTPLPSPSPYSSAAAPTPSSRQHTPTPPSIPTIAPHPEDARYRHSAPPGSMTLPSMRTIDPLSQPQNHPRPLHRRASPLPRPPQTIEMHHTPATTPQNAPFYAQQQHPPIHSPNYGYTQDPTPRYAAPHDPHLLANRGPKKEIKRRTKTGCLTCRKRRIKCDETHPTCNNCKKSKRECLGYDPIFKQVSAGQPSNTNLHPAPLGSPAISSPHQPSSSATSAASGSFQPGSRGSPNPLLGTPASTIASASPHWSNPPSRDPPAIRASSGHLQEATGIAGSRSLPPLTSLYDPRVAEQRSSSTYSSSADRRAQNMKIDDIIASLGPLPAAQQISHTENTFNEITNIYHEMYAPGLAAFFETSWYYFEENGKATFPKDTNLIEQMATFLKILEAVKVNDVAQMAYSGIFETKIVWELARTAYQSPDGTNSDLRFGLPPDGNPIEARNRLRVVDTLLTGEYLLVNPLAPPFQHPDTYRVRQHDFWYNLAEFVRKRDQPNSPASIQAREDILAKLRHLLDGRENRDVLYSIAVVRQLAPHYDPGYGSTIPQHLDETDPKHRLAMASKFILDEAQVTGGTTNVVRRFSDIASRAFVNPGVNVSRRA